MESKSLQSIRKQLKLSQSRLAQSSGISRFRISQHECGYELLSDDDLRLLQKAILNFQTARTNETK